MKFCIFAYIYFSGNKVEDFHRIISSGSDTSLKQLLFSAWPAFGHTFPVQPSGKEMMNTVSRGKGDYNEQEHLAELIKLSLERWV